MAKHRVILTPAERKHLQSLLRRSSSTAIQNRRARILLAADVGGDRPPRSDVAVAAATYVDPRTVARVRAEFARDGLDRALTGQKPVFPSRRKLSDVQEAQMLVVAQSDPPDGYARWSLRLLGKRLVELQVVEAISPETVRAALKKTIANPGDNARG
jgi:Homeodomain-like domain